MTKGSKTPPDFLGIVRHASKHKIIDARDLWEEAMRAAKAGYLDADGARCLFAVNDKGQKLLEDNEPVVEPVSPNPPVVAAMDSVSSMPSVADCVCQDRSTPLTEKQRDAIGERLLNPGAFAPYGEAKGMVSENVKDSSFECCPVHPDRSSCPGDGCKHCAPPTVDDTKDGYTLHSFGSPLTYIVVCLDGPGNYALAKRRVFKSRDEAQEAADSITDTRDPLVIEGRWHQLFLPQDLPE